MPISEIILVASGIGTVLGTLIVFFTLLEMQKQRIQTYRPEIIVETCLYKYIDYRRKLFFGNTNDDPEREAIMGKYLENRKIIQKKVIKNGIEEIIYEAEGIMAKKVTYKADVNKEKIEEENENDGENESDINEEENFEKYWTSNSIDGKGKCTNNISLNVLNIGMGAAKYLKIKWEYNIKKVIKSLEDANIIIKENINYVNFDNNGNFVESIVEDTGFSLSYLLDCEIKYIDYILPINLTSSPMYLEIPNSYFILINYLIKYESFRNIIKYKFPELILSIEYKDISNKSHIIKYILALKMLDIVFKVKDEIFVGFKFSFSINNV
jgi:hypothetical protein